MDVEILRCERRAVKTLKRRKQKLLPFQTEGVRWMLEREHQSVDGIRGGVLADEMGLGKTVQMLAVIAGHRLLTTLVVAPLSVCNQWVREVDAFTSLKCIAVSAADVSTRTFTVSQACGYDIVVVPHSAFTNVDFDEGEPHPLLVTAGGNPARWGRIILDEAHCVRNTKTKLATILTAARADVRWALTGTPLVSSPKDLRAIMHFLRAGREAAGPSLRAVLRRTKADPGIAEQQRRMMMPLELHADILELTPNERAIYANLYVSGRAMVGKFDAAVDDFDFVHLLKIITDMRMMLATTQAKMEGLLEGFDAHRPGARTLIFCNWMCEIEAVTAALGGTVDVVMGYHGSMNAQQRGQVVDTFMEPDDTGRSMAMVMQIAAGSVGLNLQAAHYVYIMSPHWNASSELQAIGRAHRSGVEHTVVVRRLIMQHTIEEFMHRKQQKKLDMAAEVLEDPRICEALATVDGGCGLTWGVIQTLFDSEYFDDDI